MNKFTRLTALLLAMLMIFSTVASAESAYQVGGMTVDNWQSIVDSAEEKLFPVDEGDSGKTVTPPPAVTPAPGAYYPYADSVSVALSADSVVAPLQITASGVAVLQNADAGQWQMQIGGEWVGITGATGSELWVTSAMMNGMTSADFRKGLGDRNAETGEYSAYTAVATVEIVAEVASTTFFMLNRAAEDEAAATPTPAPVTAANDVLTIEDANEELARFVVTINYLFQSNGAVAARPTYYQVGEHNPQLNRTLTYPVVTGYKPVATLDLPTGFKHEGTTLSIDTTVTEDVTINIYYEPAEVVYEVKYYQEKLSYPADAKIEDKYTEITADMITQSGLTESTIAEDIVADGYVATDANGVQYYASLKQYPGFLPLLYDDGVKIAANGSTDVQVRYQRLYYLLSFKLGGGYGVDPVYDKYGAPIETVGEPKRAGYEFKGWTLDATATEYVPGYDESKLIQETDDDFPKTIPAENRIYYAVWEALEVNYTVAYWLEHPDNEGEYEYLGQQTVTGTAGELTTVAAYQALTDDIKTEINNRGDAHLLPNIEHKANDADVTIAGDGTTVVNVKYDRKEYKLRFYYAMSSTSGNTTTYRVVGGTTYYFGAYTQNDDEFELLQQYSSGAQYNQTGKVDAAPTLKDAYKNVYTQNSVNPDNDTYTYHYIEFTAKYGQDISNLWPADVFNSVPTTANSGNWVGSEAFVAGWNGENSVYYSRNNTNQTIKGKYTKLDYQLLWQYNLYNKYGDGENNNEIAFLCFWENGANVGWSVPELYRYHIYVEALPGQEANETDITYNGKRYVRRDVYDTVDNSNPDEQTDPAINGLISLATHGSEGKLTGGYDAVQVIAEYTGYTNWNTTYKYYERITVDTATAQKFKTIQNEIDALVIYSDYDNDGQLENTEPLYREGYFMYFYYDRQKFTLTKVNPGYDDVLVTNLMYEQSLADQGATPLYPTEESGYEKDAYVFDGWYTSATFDADSKVDFTTATMPASNMVIYAHWVPVEYTVTVYNTPEGAAAADSEQLLYTFQVKHGQATSSAYTFDNPDHFDPESNDFKRPVNGDWEFVGWFYVDENGKETGFSFLETRITGDTVVYAKWQMNKVVKYTVYYVIDDGNDAEGSYNIDEANWVADSTMGSGLAGYTVTEAALGGTDLKEGYQTGYFPKAESHNITLDLDETLNVCIFEYVKKDAMPYTVKYLEKGTNKVLHTEKVVANNLKAIVTENYEQVGDNYVPDEFQKRLVIEADSTAEDNVIIFWYEKDLTRTTLEINHYTLDYGATQYKEYDTFSEFVTVSPNDYDAVIDVLSIENYPFNSATRSDGGMPSYAVEPDSGNKIRFTLSEGAAGVVLNLYYVETPVTINYQVAPACTGMGTVSLATETIGVVTGNAAGSEATPAGNYKFVGWYTDKACENLVSRSEHFTPTRDNGLNVAATYYAKFELDVADLTIVKTGMTDGESAIVKVEIKEPGATEATTYTIVLNKTNGYTATIADVLINSTYTVTEQNAWTWRYDDTEAKSGTVKANGNTVAIQNSGRTNQWLSDESAVENNLGNGTRDELNNQ